jgi:hypothetical protein
MLEIIALIFLTRQIGALALRKGLKPGQWKVYLVLAWFGAEILGFFIGIQLFGGYNIWGLMLFAFACAFGGYLLVHATLNKKPDSFDDDIRNIGSDERRP